MLLLDQTFAPDSCEGHYFLDGQIWSQVDPTACPENPTFPFEAVDRVTPYQVFHLVGMTFDGADVRITWDVDSSSPAAIDAAVRFLCDRPEQLSNVQLCFNKEGWFEESYDAARTAAQRIVEIGAYRGLPILRRTFIEDRTDVSPSVFIDVFQRLLEKWTPGCSLDDIRSDRAFSQFIVMADKSGELVFDHIGLDAAITTYFGHDWRRSVMGSRVDRSLPDLDYDRATGGKFRDVMARGEPRIDRVLCSIQRSPVNREWCAYYRLQLPIEDSLLCLVQLCPPQDVGIRYLTPPP